MESSHTEKKNHSSRNHNGYHARPMRWHVQLRIGCVLFCLWSFSIPAGAQPSGGQYGPIRQTYDLPKGAGKIYYVAVDGNAGQSGATLTEPTSLEAAIERVRTGDAIVMRGGTYRRGNL